MDLSTNIYQIETLHHFDVDVSKELITSLKNELQLLKEERPLAVPRSMHKTYDKQVDARIAWVTSMISVLEAGMTSRIEIVKKLEDECKRAPQLLNDAEMKVFFASLNTKKTHQQIADEVGYTEGYVRLLRHQINEKLGIRVIKL